MPLNRFALVATLFLAGCPWWSWPDATSELGILGQVLDPAGDPVVGLKVETVESTERTDETGKFGLYYKPPDTHVHFIVDDAWYRRQYVAEQDEGQTVVIQLPDTHELEVDCGTFDCQLQLHWDLSAGFSARRTGRCKAGGNTLLPGSPKGEPRVSCKPKVTEPEVELTTEYVGERLMLLPPPRDITVRVASDGTPAGCEVWVQDAQLAAMDDGSYSGSAVGDAVVQVACDGRAALPMSIAADSDSIEIPWTPDGPTLRPPPGMELDRLQLTGPEWVLTHRASASGGFALPPLPTGEYAVQLFTDEASPVPVKPEGDVKPGVVRGQLLPSGQYAAHLVLARDMSDGVLEAVLPQK